MLRRHLMFSGAAAATMLASDAGTPTMAASGANASSPGTPSPGAFSAEDVVRLAQRVAAEPFTPADTRLPRPLRDLSYDQYRMIRFDRTKAFWREAGLSFQFQPAHRGFLYEERVALFEVNDGVAHPLQFRPGLFNYGEGVPALGNDDIGFAGARVLAPLNRPDHYDEVVSFLGASYFRALGKGHVYGLSARGLAIGTADPKGEEFPSFRAFWFERPARGATEIVVHALLDSQSLAGAYRFTIRPGQVTTMDVEARLFPRRDVASVGIAPLTSMYLHGPNDRGRIDDYRPAVHDSDGLLVATSRGERLWRPLTNPRTLQVSVFRDTAPAGFGLMQRRRSFGDYHDLEAAYHRRPGLWVEPLDRWGAGSVHLVEIPTDGEIHDNIVAYWRPETPLKAGEEAKLRYRLHWCSEQPGASTVAAFGSTRVGAGSGQGMRRFVLDAAGGRLADHALDATFKLELWSSAGSLHHGMIQRNPETGGIRLAFELRPGSAPLVELGARVLDGENALTETWLYRWTA